MLKDILRRSTANWQATANPITDLDDDERNGLLGVVIPRQALAELITRPRDTTAIANLPAAVDWRNMNGRNHVSPVKHQLNCGSCVSFCTCAVVESAVSIATGAEIDLSEADLHFCSAHGAGCGGWWPSDAIDEAGRRGIPPEEFFPYPSAFDEAGNPGCRLHPDRDKQLYAPTGYSTLMSTAERKQWLATRGPVCAVFHVYDDFFALSNEVYRHVTGGHAGYHCVEVIGYSDADQCWIAKNSWGADWGDGGFFRIGYGECGIDDTSNDRDPDGSLNRFPMHGVEGVRLPGGWRSFQLSVEASASTAGTVTAVSRIPNSMELWWVAPNGSVQGAFWYEGGSWQTYEIGGPGSASPDSGVTAVSRIPGSMELWWVAPNGSVQGAFWYEGGSWGRYEIAPAGSAAPGAGITAVSRIPTGMELWWVAPNGSVQGAFWYEGGSWQTYEIGGPGSASLGSGIAAVSRIPGSMELWWVAPNGSVQGAFWYEGGSWGRYEIGGGASAAPGSGIAAVSRIPGSMELWWVAPNGSVQGAYWYEGGSWQTYEIGGPGSASPGSGIAAVSRIPGSMELWWSAPNGSVEGAYWYEGANWSRYEIAPAGSAAPGAGITAVSRIPNSMELWWIGANGSVQDAYWYE
ncbi:C1 family peptidase [Nonomuraea zeae]|uniref:Peptidase C1A papain C-terminal domain-containing protein n=1 Tax=Nonomuraea zeae TaxID=1642303 RepID=A0A5S4G8P8_9ACTN|nr:C1 family peptidase [Nonomuraea zeae]TMR29395.1 hypothetical protein ETD85_32615 [Nonomuraea zeae]